MFDDRIGQKKFPLARGRNPSGKSNARLMGTFPEHREMGSLREIRCVAGQGLKRTVIRKKDEQRKVGSRKWGEKFPLLLLQAWRREGKYTPGWPLGESTRGNQGGT